MVTWSLDYLRHQHLVDNVIFLDLEPLYDDLLYTSSAKVIPIFHHNLIAVCFVFLSNHTICSITTLIPLLFLVASKKNAVCRYNFLVLDLLRVVLITCKVTPANFWQFFFVWTCKKFKNLWMLIRLIFRQNYFYIRKLLLHLLINELWPYFLEHPLQYVSLIIRVNFSSWIFEIFFTFQSLKFFFLKPTEKFNWISHIFIYLVIMATKVVPSFIVLLSTLLVFLTILQELLIQFSINFLNLLINWFVVDLSDWAFLKGDWFHLIERNIIVLHDALLIEDTILRGNISTATLCSGFRANLWTLFIEE